MHVMGSSRFWQTSRCFPHEFLVPIGQRRQASAWKYRVLPVGHNDGNEVSCSDRDTASRPG